MIKKQLLILPILLLSVLLTAYYQVWAQPAVLDQPPPAAMPAHPERPAGHGPASISSPIPNRGDQKLLVILVDFPDESGKFSGRAWYEAFFGPQFGSFTDYFKEVSYGQLRYSGDVVGMAGFVPVVNSANVAYVRLDLPLTYYADGQYGFNMSWGNFPQNNGGVVYDALVKLDIWGFDFSPYADSVTGEVENLLIVFAGSAYQWTGDPVHSLGPTAYRLDWAGLPGGYTSSGNYHFNNYTFCHEERWNQTGQMAYVGLCVHEQGHGLGVPDLYDHSYRSYGAGNFDLMAFGNYGSTSGQWPFHPGAFSRERIGWLNFVEFPATSGTVMTYTLRPAEYYGDAIRLFPNGNRQSQEYFLLENRQPIGYDNDWGNAGLCAGLIIWHVDQDIVQNYPYHVNTTGVPPNKGVVVVEADGGYDLITSTQNYGECDDTWFPGRTWDAMSIPPATTWDGIPAGLAVTVLAANPDRTITLAIDAAAIDIALPYSQHLPLQLNAP